jgi:hypothetical protein
VRLVLLAVGRRLIPNIIEATLVPSVLFFVAAAAFGLPVAFGVAIAWSYLALGRRILRRQPLPALIVLGALGLTVRTLLALGSGSAFVYFVQPVIGTIVVGTAFLVSIALGRPLIGRFARDFCALAPDIESGEAIVSLYRRLTYLRAAVNFAAAITTFVLLQSLPMTLFVAVRPLAAWTITVTGVVLTVSAAVRAARTEGLTAVVTPGGNLAAIRV